MIKGVNKKHIIVVLILLSMTICFISIFLANKKSYFTAFLTVGDVTILSKQTISSQSTLSLTIDNSYLVDKYPLLKQTKTFTVADQSVYDSITIDHPVEHAGITLKVDIPTKHLSKDELLKLQKDPFQALGDDRYTEYISILAIHH